MAPLTKFLYRILRSNCRAVFLPHNRDFLQSSLHSCQDSLMLLSRGFPIVNNLPNNPYLELERAFREGNEDDIQILFSVLPSLLRFSRAATLIEKHFQGLEHLKCNRGKIYSALDDPNMLSGALLVSKLYYTEKELLQRPINTIVKEGLKELRALLKSELEKELLHRHDIKKVLNESISLPKGTVYEKKRSQVLALINALDRAIVQQERRRERDSTASIVHLVDQVLQPEGAYSRATPITYSILYATVINAIANLGDHNLQAVGINFPQRFLTRIVVKNSPHGHMHRHNQTSVVNAEDFIKSGPVQFSRRKDLQNVPKEINFMDLLGDWVGFYSDGMQEVRIRYRKDKDKNTRVLEAVKIDSDQHLPAGEIAWSIDLNQISKKSKLLAMNTPYQVNVQVAQPGFTHVQSVPYTLTIVVLPASIFQPASDVALAHLLTEQTQDIEAPYFELQLVPVEPERIEEGFTDHSVPSDTITNSTAQAMRSINGGPQGTSTFAPTTIARTYNSSNTHPSLRSPSHDHAQEEVSVSEGSSRYTSGPRLTQRRSPVLRSPASGRNTVTSTDLEGGMALESLSFCRTVDLDRCLLDISDKGVTPLTPTTYLTIMNANGKGADRLPEVLRPATSNAVVCRMAANLANHSAGTLAERLLGVVDASNEQDSAFWTAVRRCFDDRIKRAGLT